MNDPFYTALQQQTVASVVPFTPSDRLQPLLFTAENKSLTPEILNDTVLFSNYTEKALNGARYGIGGYAELRTIYSRSAVFDSAETGEPRRLHLGTDIWGEVGTPVFAPLAATVHSTGFHEALGDYGAVIILQHQVANFDFYTLYGHLSKNSLADKEEGKQIAQGEQFANFGAPPENGHWPPHLHFQIIKNLGGMRGDYPGVCRASEADFYLQNCPDPDVLLRLNQYLK